MSTPEDAAFVLTRVRIEIRHRPSAMRVVTVFVPSAGRLDHAVQRDLFDDLDLSHRVFSLVAGVFFQAVVVVAVCGCARPNSIVTGSSHLLARPRHSGTAEQYLPTPARCPFRSA